MAMDIKSKLKSIFGAERLSAAKGEILHYLYTVEHSVIPNSRIFINYSVITDIETISQPGYHFFRGYYDINYLSDDKRKLLVHRLKTNYQTGRDGIDIGYYSVVDKSFHKMNT